MNCFKCKRWVTGTLIPVCRECGDRMLAERQPVDVQVPAKSEAPEEDNVFFERGMPVTIILDRYNGCYSRGRWTAWPREVFDIPAAHCMGSIECNAFWKANEIPVGRGHTPQAALSDLRLRLAESAGDKP